MRIELALLRAVALARSPEPILNAEGLVGVNVVSTPGRLLIAAGTRHRFFFASMVQAPNTETGTWTLHPGTVHDLCSDPSEFAKLDMGGRSFITPANLGGRVDLIATPFPNWRKIVPDSFVAGGVHNDVLCVDGRFVELLVQAHRLIIPEDVTPTIRIRQHKAGEYVAAIPGVPAFGAILAGMKQDTPVYIPGVQ